MSPTAMKPITTMEVAVSAFHIVFFWKGVGNRRGASGLSFAGSDIVIRLLS
ncbi:hypothetical protein OAE61_00920 [Verrucomicrobiales bacterium]|nr:hypothetical protein [Verrucomicrobiales bacterium]